MIQITTKVNMRIFFLSVYMRQTITGIGGFSKDINLNLKML